MRILVVDDDPINRFLLLNMLEQQGYMDAYEAEDGNIAIELAKQVEPDLVLLDVIMPGMDGYEVAPILKKMSGDIYLPIIFITALEDEDGLARCLEVGGDDFVSKPFDRVILAAKIRAHSRTRQLSKKAYEQNKQLSFYQNAVEREHQIVEHIFENALAIDDSLTSYVDFQLKPATTFNGDLFLMCQSPSGGFYFLMGDFTGHGLASSIGALPVSKAFNTMCHKGLSLMEIAETINDTLLTLLPDDMFFAAILVEINHCGKRLDVWNGGMPPLVLQNSAGEIIRRFESIHMSLGILDDKDFEADVERYEGNYGDRVVGFSDGLAEIENKQQQLLGESGVEQWLIDYPKISSQEIVNKANTYLDGGERKDDITLVFYTFQKLSPIDVSSSISHVPIEIINNLNAEHIKLGDPIEVIVNVIVNQLGLYHCHSALFTVISELYNNAVDHGVLGLDSSVKAQDDGFFDYFSLRQERLEALSEATIVITTKYSPLQHKLYFKIKDSGKGFDESSLKKLNAIEHSYGRGIALVKELCESVQYSNGGNTVDIEFKI